MKIKCLAVFLIVASVPLFSGKAFAQACTANKGTLSPSALSASGNNCNNNIAQLKICGNGDTLNQAGVDIYQISITGSNNFTITVTSNDFAPEVALTSTTTCSSNQPCVIDQSPPGAATAPYSVAGSASGLANGNYFLFVADTGADVPGCGNYNVNITGTLPVKLQKFSVK